MSRTYVLGPLRRLANVGMHALLRVGVAPPHTYLLTVQGRRTGTMHSTPVTLVEDDTGRWLVAPYGEVGWVKNTRAAGQVRLTRGRHSQELGVDEVDGVEAAGVLRRYVNAARIVRPFFDVGPASPLAAFEAEAPLHPVFRLRPRA